MSDVRAVSDGIAQQIQEFFRQTIDPLRERLMFTQRPSDGSLRGDSMVLFVGNHSSGKSTFINHLLGAEVQETGMAPTHDDFTILRYSDEAREIPGNALLSNPDLGFEELLAFGASFERRIKLRTGPFPILREVMLVDTPGMIDSADRTSKRDYDFDNVVAWLAQRADLVVLFFDPERPGTTAETVDVFARKLSNLDHKLVVVLNKVDQFRNVTDFARCYGTLCWNLGKVLRTKDLPQIHASYLAVPGAPQPNLPLSEFDAPRDRLLDRIKNAPSQRADNLITETGRYIEGLLAHGEVLDDLRRRAIAGPRQCLFYGVLAVAAIVVYVGLAHALDSGTVRTIAIASAAIVVTVIVTRIASKRAADRFVTRLDAELDEAALAVETRARARGTPPDRARQCFDSVRELTRTAARALAPSRLPKLRGGDRRTLENWLQNSLPELRKWVHRRLAQGGS